MKDQNINHTFLDPVLAGTQVDVYYHFGLSSDDPLMEQLRDVRAVVLAGSGGRIANLTQEWSSRHDNSPVISFPKEERFITRYCNGILFTSHGMGMPSGSIAMQELMRMVYFLKGGDLDALDEVFWARVGTSGGVGLPGGAVIVSTEGVMADLRPYRVLNGGFGEYWFDGHFPQPVVDRILELSQDLDFPVVSGRTVAGNEFFLEQFRLDGAICMESEQTKAAWLSWIHSQGVRNIEMEGAMIAGYLNHWGFSRFAMVCAALLDRLAGDQVTASPAELRQYSLNSGEVLFNYLHATLD